MSVPRRLTATLCAGAAVTLLGTGSAAAAPLAFSPGQPLEASCSEPHGLTTLVPVPGSGAFTPYRLPIGQLLVPTEFRLTSAGPGLKTRHLVPDIGELTAVKPLGSGGDPLKCEISGTIGGEPFTAVVVGVLVGGPRR